ncbi:MAG: hypothetical protein GF317_08535 [Candidatus Lokiarchaeota archaeon]|nr:hypothetical protein [Candidatus Lokiarchaeota archaeon]MBD3199761.1 hypothetical protein [Candidatus Lokiarchaeota archaeon]
MNYRDYKNEFSCPKCGRQDALYLMKADGNDFIIKQRCSEHGARSFRVPIMEKNNYMDIIQDRIFRCYKCGEKTTLDHIKFNGPYAIIKGMCPNHSNSLPDQKIWSLIYLEIKENEEKDEAKSSVESVLEESTNEVASGKIEMPVEDDPTPEMGKPEAVDNYKEPGEVDEIQKKFCGNCGTRLQGEERFCPGCGEEI